MCTAPQRELHFEIRGKKVVEVSNRKKGRRGRRRVPTDNTDGFPQRFGVASKRSVWHELFLQILNVQFNCFTKTIKLGPIFLFVGPVTIVNKNLERAFHPFRVRSAHTYSSRREKWLKRAVRWLTKKATESSKPSKEETSLIQSTSATVDLKWCSLERGNLRTIFFTAGNLRGGDGYQDTTQWSEQPIGGNLRAYWDVAKLTKILSSTWSILIENFTTGDRRVRELSSEYLCRKSLKSPQRRILTFWP